MALVHLHRHLQQRLPRILRKRRRELMFASGMITPVSFDLQAGVQEVVSEEIREFGEGQALADEANDVRIVDIDVTEVPYRVKLFAAAFGITFLQSRAYEEAQRNGRTWSVRDTKQDVTTRVIQEKINTFAAYGDGSVTGFVNNADVPLNNSAFDPFAGATTADQLISFFVEEIGDVRKATNLVETPDQILIGTDLDTEITATRLPDGTQNVKQYLLENIEWIGDIKATTELDSANLEANNVNPAGTNRDRVVLYPADPVVHELHMEPIQMVPAEYTYNKGLKQMFPMFGVTSPTIINYTSAMRYIEHTIKP